MRSEGFYVNGKSTDTSWDRTCDLPICSTAPHHCATAVQCVRGKSTIILTNEFQLNTVNDKYGLDSPVASNTVGAAKTTRQQKTIQEEFMIQAEDICSK